MQRFDTWEDAGLTDIRNTEKYNWKDMCDGDIWTAKQGEDFTCSMESFRTILRSYAKRHGLKVIVHTHGVLIRFKFSKSEDV